MAYELTKSFVFVTIGIVILCFIVFDGGFDSVKTETDLAHYAEKKSKVLKLLLPKWMKMPLNTVVNILYLIFGAYWCAVIHDRKDKMSEQDCLMFFVFNTMACFYAPIQTLRILLSTHRLAILDQWVTLPFFMWVFIWSWTISKGFNIYMCFLMTCLSLCSYVMALYISIGFEMALTIHILVAVCGAFLVSHSYGTKKSRLAFVLAMISCFGFVILKILDLHLPTLHPIFTKISGHFLSKIADAFQIHFVNKFFEAILEAKQILETKKKM